MAAKDSTGHRAKLDKLSPREREVLHYRCQGSDYETIANALFITDRSVKTYVNRIYDKLGLKGYGTAARLKLLFEEYCPLLEQQGAPAGDPERDPAATVIEGEVLEEAESSLSPEDERILDEDQYAIVPAAPRGMVPPSRARRSRWGLIGVILGVVLGICLGVTGVLWVLRSEISPLSAGPTEGPANLPLVTPNLSPTFNAELSTTQTSLAVENAVVLTATLPPATPVPSDTPLPAINLPFADDFDQGASPGWRILNGQWITAGGRYTVIGDEQFDDWIWSTLDEPSWQNYRLTVDTVVPYAYSAAQGQLAIAVRMSNTQSEYLGFVVDTFMKGGWAFIGIDEGDIQYLAGTGGYVPENATIQLEANGSEFVARVNGQVFQTITISGFDSGGIALGITCDTELGKCPSFDNFSLESTGP